jgi:hypothetical protein
MTTPTLSSQEAHWILQAAQFIVGSLPNAQQPAVERVLHQLSVICTILNTNVGVQVVSFFFCTNTCVRLKGSGASCVIWSHRHALHPFGKYECYFLVILRCALFTQVVTFF